MSADPSTIAVALLCGSPEAAASLHAAIAAMGAAVVYETAARAFDPDALARSGANVVVVNLSHADADLEPVQELIHSPQYRVVFNDSDVSNGLTGWDHARWLRHLAAKIFDTPADLHPPRPPGAEAVPARAVAVPLAPATREDGVAAALELLSEQASWASEPTSAPSAADAEAFNEPVQDWATAEPAEEADEWIEPALAAAAAAHQDPLGVSRAGIDEFDLDLIDFDALPAAPELATDAPARAGADSGLDADLADFDFFASDESAQDEPTLPVAAAVPEQAVAEHADTHASASLSAPANIDEMPALDFEFVSDTVAEDTPAATAPAVPAPPAAIAVPEWTLEDVLPDFDEAPAPAAASEFGIETVRAADFLAPEADTDAARLDAVPDKFTLELIPIEEAITPSPFEQEGRESWLEQATVVPSVAQVRRVWVLGASIGGPESVREFLAALPRDYPALFLLAQHLGDEFVDMMASQLARVSAMTVRTPQHGERASHGEILIVPSAQRLRVDAAGVVMLERVTAEGAYSPSIDRLLHDCADMYGAEAGAIVFSGMGDDAVEGCRYLAGKGGNVYAQRPDTCVVSTMVDGVCDTGVVSFMGSPQELAEKLRGEAA